MIKIFKSLKKFQIKNRFNFSEYIKINQDSYDIPTYISLNLQIASDLIYKQDYQNNIEIHQEASQRIKDAMENIQYFDQEQLTNTSIYLNNLDIENNDYSDRIKYKLFQLMRMKLINSKSIIYIIDNYLSEKLDQQDIILFNGYIQPNLQSLNQEQLSQLVQLYTKLYDNENYQVWLNILQETIEATQNMNMQQIFNLTQGLSFSYQNQMPQNDQLWDVLQNRIKDIIPFQFHHQYLSAIVQSFSSIKKGDEQLWDILKQKTLENVEFLDINDICRILEGVKDNHNLQEFFSKNLELQLINQMDQIQLEQLLSLIGSRQIWTLIDQKIQQYLDNLDKEKYLLLIISIIDNCEQLQKTTEISIYQKYKQFQYDNDVKKALKKYFIQLEIDSTIIDTYFKDFTEL